MLEREKDKVEKQPAAKQTAKEIEVTRDQLPLSCPMPQFELWNYHPRIFLPIEESGREVCPYCGTIYILKNSIT